MPVKTPHTKAEKQAVVHTEMHKFKHGTLHSGSKTGPKVTSRKQAIAIALSESGQSKNKAPKAGEGESKEGYDRSSHHKGNPGFAEGRHEPNQSYAQEQYEHWGNQAGPKPSGSSTPHSFPTATNACGFGHSASQKCGPLRNSGHSGAHRIGKR